MLTKNNKNSKNFEEWTSDEKYEFLYGKIPVDLLSLEIKNRSFKKELFPYGQVVLRKNSGDSMAFTVQLGECKISKFWMGKYDTNNFRSMLVEVSPTHRGGVETIKFLDEVLVPNLRELAILDKGSLKLTSFDVKNKDPEHPKSVIKSFIKKLDNGNYGFYVTISIDNMVDQVTGKKLPYGKLKAVNKKGKEVPLFPEPGIDESLSTHCITSGIPTLSFEIKPHKGVANIRVKMFSVIINSTSSDDNEEYLMKANILFGDDESDLDRSLNNMNLQKKKVEKVDNLSGLDNKELRSPVDLVIPNDYSNFVSK